MKLNAYKSYTLLIFQPSDTSGSPTRLNEYYRCVHYFQLQVICTDWQAYCICYNVNKIKEHTHTHTHRVDNGCLSVQRMKFSVHDTDDTLRLLNMKIRLRAEIHRPRTCRLASSECRARESLIHSNHTTVLVVVLLQTRFSITELVLLSTSKVVNNSF